MSTIDTNGASPVPVATNRWRRRSPGTSLNRPFGRPIRSRSPIRNAQSRGVNAPSGNEPDEELETPGAARRGRRRVRSLEKRAVDDQTEREVLAGLERRDSVVGPDREPGDRRA